MKKMGRPRLPADLLAARGSRYAKARAKEEAQQETVAPKVQPERQAPRKPAWLTKPAAKVWDELIPTLQAMGVLAVCDGATVARYCQTMVDWIRYDAAIRKEGPWYEHPKGGRRPHPAVRMRTDAAKVLKDCEDRLGLNPQSRSGLHLTLAWKPTAPTLPTPSAPKPAATEPKPAPAPIDGERFFKRS